MAFIQKVTYRKLPSGKKHYTEEVKASTPTAAKNRIQNTLGCDIEMIKCLTTVPSTTPPST